MSYLLDNFPLTECYVRNEFLFDQQEGHGQFTQGYIVGFKALSQTAPMFYVIVNNGAMWADIPLHAICRCEGAPRIDLTEAAWWDCFSSTFSICQFDTLKNYDVDCMSRTKQIYRASYIATIEWDGRWANIADQHKCHHLVWDEQGRMLAYPNNKCLWLDQSWIQRPESMPRYKVNTRRWSVENHVGVTSVVYTNYTADLMERFEAEYEEKK